jgi:hypothetical protein
LTDFLLDSILSEKRFQKQLSKPTGKQHNHKGFPLLLSHSSNSPTQNGQKTSPFFSDEEEVAKEGKRSLNQANPMTKVSARPKKEVQGNVLGPK